MISKRRIHEIVEVAAKGDRASRVFDLFILTLIALNVAAFVAETVGALQARYGAAFRIFETVSVAIFTVEYIVRVWSCTESESYKNHPLKGRVRFMVTALALIDLFAILPFYMGFLGGRIDLRFIRAVRLFRVFRIAKLGRYSKALQTLGTVFKAQKEELATAFFIMLLLLLLASSMMYYAENRAQPEVFSSIPHSMWWGIATLTTVGYGDVTPVTPIGKLVASFVALLGIAMFAIPTGILGSGFQDVVQSERRKSAKCPHCGREISVQ